MSDVLKISGPIRVGRLAADPVSAEQGWIYYNTTSNKFRMYQGVAFVDVVDADVIAALVASNIAYERVDGLKKNIQVTSDNTETALTDLDDAIGDVSALGTPTNYLTSSEAEVAARLAGIDTALASAGGTEFGDDVFRVTGNLDATKKIALEADGLSAATTRTIIMPDTDINLADIITNNAKLTTNTANVAAAGATMDSDTSLVGSNYFLDEDNMISNDATKVASQQSIKTYVDATVAAQATFDDATFKIIDSAGDSLGTKFDVSAVTVADKTIFMPDTNVDLGGIAINSAKVSADGSVTSHSDVTNAGSGIIISSAERTNLGNQSGINTGDELAASQTVAGVAEVATVTEIDAQTDDTRMISPLGLAGSALQTKVDGIEALADVTDAINVAAAGATMDSDTSLVGNGYFLDEDNMISNDATKVASQQSIKAYVDLRALDADVIKKDGSVAFTGAQSMGGFKLSSLSDPTVAQDAATKAYVDTTIEGLKPKEAVRVATTAAGTLTLDYENGDTIDGIILATGDRILIKDQVAAAENGIYTVNVSGAPTRATDFDSISPINEINGAMIPVQEGTANAAKIFVQQGAVATIDTDNINFVFFNSNSTLVGGNGVTASGSNISVDHDGNGLTFSGVQLALELDGSSMSKSATGLKVAALGVGTAELAASAVTDAKVAAGIDAAKLADGTVSNIEFQHINSLSSNAQTQLNAKLENLLEDTTPQLGGNLDVLAQAVESSTSDVVLAGQSSVKRAKQASKASFIEEEYIHGVSLLGSQAGTVISNFTFAYATVEGLEISYKLKEATSNDIKIGTIRVVTNGTSVVLNDVGTETADTGIVFSAAINGTNVEIKYDSGANGATMRADVKKFLA